MTLILRSLLTLSLLYPLLACTESTPTPGQSEQPTNASKNTDSDNKTIASSEPTESEIKSLISEYKNFKALNDDLKPSNIHGSKVKTFLDNKAFQVYENKSFPYPDGTVSIKESFGGDGTLNRIYVMKKIKDYDPENNDWFYAVMSTEGVPSQKGKVSFCIQCHASAKAKDYIYGFE